MCSLSRGSAARQRPAGVLHRRTGRRPGSRWRCFVPAARRSRRSGSGSRSLRRGIARPDPAEPGRRRAYRCALLVGGIAVAIGDYPARGRQRGFRQAGTGPALRSAGRGRWGTRWRRWSPPPARARRCATRASAGASPRRSCSCWLSVAATVTLGGGLARARCRRAVDRSRPTGVAVVRFFGAGIEADVVRALSCSTQPDR